MIAVHEDPLQLVIPEKRHQDCHDNLGQDKHIVDVMSQQPVYPVHTGQPLGQGECAPCIQ